MGRLAPQLAVTFCLPHTAIMATITDKNAQESASDTPPSLEKGTADRRPSAGDGYVPANLREEDFRTRNGLNLKSFQRRDWGTRDSELDRSMKKRHLNMIAIGGSIGAGFFVGSGGALATGGPGSILLCFLIAGVMIFNVVHSLGELAVMYPVSGGFYTYAVRFIDPSWGFAMGWNYVLQWIIVLPFELVVATFTCQYWNRDVSIAVWVTVFWVVIILINIFGTLGYAEEEFWSSCFKLGAVVIFMIVAIILICGGGPSDGLYDEYWGARLWYDPGAFQNGFRGFCSVFVTAAFSYAGTELVGLAAAESENPLKALPSAVKQVFWRITFFYVVGLTLVCMLVSSTDERLLNAENAYREGTAPFVLAARDAGLNGYDDFMNVVILVSVVSLGVSCVYGGSRTLTALAEQGYAPKIFTYIDRSGRPLPSVLVNLAFGAIAYVQLAEDGSTVFGWLLAMSSLAALLTWGSICYSHIRFRQAWKRQGHTVDEIPHQAIFGVWGAWVGLILCIVIFAAQFFVAVAPVGGGVNGAEGFFNSMLTVPVVLFFWAVGYLWKRQGFLNLDQIDVDSGRRPIDWEYVHEQRRLYAAYPWWRKAISAVW